MSEGVCVEQEPCVDALQLPLAIAPSSTPTGSGSGSGSSIAPLSYLSLALPCLASEVVK